MNKEELLKLAEKYQKKADRDYLNYQSSGVTRYETSYMNNEYLAMALTIAAKATDEYNTFILMKSQIADFAQRAQRLKYSADFNREKLTQSLLDDIIEYAVLQGLVRKL